jgi:hypothetical protein
MAKKNKKGLGPGKYSLLFGDNYRNRWCEFFIGGRDLDYEPTDVLALMYGDSYDFGWDNPMSEFRYLVEQKLIVPTRVIEGTVLYQWGITNNAKAMAAAYDAILFMDVD